MLFNDTSSDGFPLFWKIFCVTFVVVSFYYMFKPIFCGINRTGTPRSRASRGNMDESNAYHHHSSQFQGRGLESSDISSLPMFQFKNTEEEGEEKRTNTECAICLGEFEEEEWVKELPYCTHVFHVSCIDTWCKSHSNCPLCRSKVQHNNLTLDLESQYLPTHS